jgi:TatD DNase family protein
MLVDTHCHLDQAYFPEGAEGPMDRARQAGVVGFVVIGVGRTLEPAREAVALAQRHPDRVACTVGVHPHDAKEWSPAVVAELDRWAALPEVVAIGEMGLDYHYDHSPRDLQRASFVDQIALARRHRKKIIVHTREAQEDTLELLRSEGARDVGGVIHCFSEDVEFARSALDLGFVISFSGIVTFKSAHAVHETARWVPGDAFMVETDSPYLAPVPMRGKPCEPAYVVHTARRIAELRGEPLEDVARATTANAERVFGRSFRAE